MNAFIYISASLNLNSLEKDCHTLSESFPVLRTETEMEAFFHAFTKTQYETLICFITNELEANFLSEHDYAKPKNIYFYCESKELVHQIKQKRPEFYHFENILEVVNTSNNVTTLDELYNVSTTEAPISSTSTQMTEMGGVDQHDLSNDVLEDEPLRNQPKGYDTSQSKPSITNTVQYQENPLHSRTRQIQKELFSKQQWTNHKLVAVWSPVGRVGVTTFAINLALYLSKHRIYTSLLEGVTSKPALQKHLTRYSVKPDNWVSYASTIHKEIEPRMASWIYENVIFLPFSNTDLQYNWNPPLIEAYMTTPKITDITIVDLPSGSLEGYTRDALQYIDELFILFDDSYVDLIEWRQYIDELTLKTKIKVHLIMSSSYTFSKVQDISNEMDLPLLTTMPALHERYMKNNYEKKPLILQEDVPRELIQAYDDVTHYLFNRSFIKEEEPAALSKFARTKASWLAKLKFE